MNTQFGQNKKDGETGHEKSRLQTFIDLICKGF